MIPSSSVSRRIFLCSNLLRQNQNVSNNVVLVRTTLQRKLYDNPVGLATIRHRCGCYRLYSYSPKTSPRPTNNIISSNNTGGDGDGDEEEEEKVEQHPMQIISSEKQAQQEQLTGNDALLLSLSPPPPLPMSTISLSEEEGRIKSIERHQQDHYGSGRSSVKSSKIQQYKMKPRASNPDVFRYSYSPKTSPQTTINNISNNNFGGGGGDDEEEKVEQQQIQIKSSEKQEQQEQFSGGDALSLSSSPPPPPMPISFAEEGRNNSSNERHQQDRYGSGSNSVKSSKIQQYKMKPRASNPDVFRKFYPKKIHRPRRSDLERNATKPTPTPAPVTSDTTNHHVVHDEKEEVNSSYERQQQQQQQQQQQDVQQVKLIEEENTTTNNRETIAQQSTTKHHVVHDEKEESNTSFKEQQQQQQQQQDLQQEVNSVEEKNTTTKKPQTVAQHLIASGEKLPTTNWIKISGISPMSSLESMLAGITQALEFEKNYRGILDLDAMWDPPLTSKETKDDDDDDDDENENETIPFLSFTTDDEGSSSLNNSIHNNKTNFWINKAKLILSPFGRPTGWKVQLDNRSIVYALLMHAKETPIFCASKQVRIEEYRYNDDDDDDDDNNGDHDGQRIIRRTGKFSKYWYANLRNGINNNNNNNQGNMMDKEYPQISDATIRVENCPDNATPLTLLNLFSRFDLRMDGPSVVQWDGQTNDGKTPPTTWLVYFADPAWARAALREKQGAQITGCTITLAQYPRQIL